MSMVQTRVYVRDAVTLTPLVGASVTLGTQTVLTDRYGNAAFTIALGSYPTTVSMTGYITKTGTATFTDATPKTVSLTPGTAPPPPPVFPPPPEILNGFSGFPNDTPSFQTNIDAIIAAIDKYQCNCYRMSFTPSWTSGSRPYNPAKVDYFLQHCSHYLIIDRNHHTENDTMNWPQAEADIMEVLSRWGNNNSVIIEIVNEFVWDTAGTVFDHCAPIISRIKALGYTNKILVNKQTLANDWRQIGADYYGHHQYFDDLDSQVQPPPFNSLANAKLQASNAIAAGCVPLCNTEIGASFHENQSFTPANVNTLNAYLAWCSANKVGNMIWMKTNLSNLPKYETLGLIAFGVVNPPPPSPLQYILDVWPSLGGTTTPTGILSIESGTAVSITATAAQGYKFGGWQVTIGASPVVTYPDTVNPLTLTVTAATVVMSLFSLVPEPPTCPTGYHWDATANTCVQDTVKTVAGRSIGPLGVPTALLHQLWRLRERFIRPEVHRKLHPLV